MLEIVVALFLGLLFGAVGGAVLASWKRIDTQPPMWLRTFKLRPWKPSIITWMLIGILCVTPSSVVGFLIGYNVSGLSKIDGSFIGIAVGTTILIALFMRVEERYQKE